jgi:hypothetical protein
MAAKLLRGDWDAPLANNGNAHHRANSMGLLPRRRYPELSQITLRLS